MGVRNEAAQRECGAKASHRPERVTFQRKLGDPQVEKGDLGAQIASKFGRSQIGKRRGHQKVGRTKEVAR